MVVKHAHGTEDFLLVGEGGAGKASKFHYSLSCSKLCRHISTLCSTHIRRHKNTSTWHAFPYPPHSSAHDPDSLVLLQP
eukprot:5254617-Ditylum_brightwellii.AAC.1